MAWIVNKEGFKYGSVDPRNAVVPTERRAIVDLTPPGVIPQEVVPALERVGKVPKGSDRPPRNFSVKIFPDTAEEPVAVLFHPNGLRAENAHEALEKSLALARKGCEHEVYVRAEISVMPPGDVKLERRLPKSLRKKLEAEKQPTDSDPSGTA